MKGIQPNPPFQQVQPPAMANPPIGQQFNNQFQQQIPQLPQNHYP